jgi:hypothetical protein
MTLSPHRMVSRCDGPGQWRVEGVPVVREARMRWRIDFDARPAYAPTLYTAKCRICDAINDGELIMGEDYQQAAERLRAERDRRVSAAFVLDEEVKRSGDEPAGYLVRHTRATDTLHFGPFPTIVAATMWLCDHPDVFGLIHPLYLDVDWNRNGPGARRRDPLGAETGPSL